MSDAPGRMDPGDLRALGHRAVDWIVDYLERVESFPVLSRSSPGDLLRALPPSPPEQGLGANGWDPIFADLETHARTVVLRRRRALDRRAR